MKNMKKISVVIITVIAVIASIGFVRHERRQSSEIMKLRQEIKFLNVKTEILFAKTENHPEADSFRYNCIKYANEGGQNYLAIGNSITLHDICDYWWTNCGMAASEKSKDYFHLVTEELRKHNKLVNSYAYGSSVWETMAHDRAESLSLIDPYLNEHINIITIQLGENVTDLTTFESDYEYLIMHIKQKAPNAQIITVSDFWENGERDNMKFRASEKCNVLVADIREIKENRDYMCGINAEVLGDDGEKHIVKHEGVARHPGDKGMRYIADRIIECINMNKKGELNHE